MISYIRNTTWPTENCYELRYFKKYLVDVRLEMFMIIRKGRRFIDQPTFPIISINSHNTSYRIVSYSNYCYYIWLISHQAFSLCHPSEHMLINLNVLNYEIPIKATTIRQQHYMGSIKETFQTKIVLFCCP